MNKEERKEYLRNQRETEHDAYQKKEQQKKMGLWVLGIVLIVAVGGVLFWAVSEEGKRSVDETGIASPITESDNTFGNEESSVSFVEYGDFECPACANFYNNTLPILKEEYSDTVHFAYRHFPLTTHKKAERAARVAEAAALQGEFWAMHDILFEQQAEWANGDEDALWEQYAQDLGLDVARFLEDVKSDEVKQKVEADLRSGKEASVPGTPSLFINGKPTRARSISELRSELDKALAEVKQEETRQQGIESENSEGEESGDITGEEDSAPENEE